MMKPLELIAEWNEYINVLKLTSGGISMDLMHTLNKCIKQLAEDNEIDLIMCDDILVVISKVDDKSWIGKYVVQQVGGDILYSGGHSQCVSFCDGLKFKK